MPYPRQTCETFAVQQMAIQADINANVVLSLAGYTFRDEFRAAELSPKSKQGQTPVSECEERTCPLDWAIDLLQPAVFFKLSLKLRSTFADLPSGIMRFRAISFACK
jgi:hypothetical protein